MGVTTEVKVIGKDEVLFYLCLSLHGLYNTIRNFFKSWWWKFPSLLLSCLYNVALSLWTYSLEQQQHPWWFNAPWVQKYNCLQNGILLHLLSPPVLLSFTPFLLLLFNWVYICAISVYVFLFDTSVEEIYGQTGWLHFPFQIKYPGYHYLLSARNCRDPLPIVPQYVLIENLHPPQFFSNILQFMMAGPAGSNRGNLGSVPAPMARGCHGPHNTLLLALWRNYATQKRWPGNREGGGGEDKDGDQIRGNQPPGRPGPAD